MIDVEGRHKLVAVLVVVVGATQSFSVRDDVLLPVYCTPAAATAHWPQPPAGLKRRALTGWASDAK